MHMWYVDVDVDEVGWLAVADHDLLSPLPTLGPSKDKVFARTPARS